MNEEVNRIYTSTLINFASICLSLFCDSAEDLRRVEAFDKKSSTSIGPYSTPLDAITIPENLLVLKFLGTNSSYYYNFPKVLFDFHDGKTAIPFLCVIRCSR